MHVGLRKFYAVQIDVFPHVDLLEAIRRVALWGPSTQRVLA